MLGGSKWIRLFRALARQSFRLLDVANVIARYCEADLPLARIWLRSWKARGWKTGIRFDTGISFRIINFSHRLRDRGRPKAKKYGTRGWLNAPLVKFPPGTTEADVINCGRPL